MNSSIRDNAFKDGRPFTFVNAETNAALNAGADPKELIHASFRIAEQNEKPGDAPPPPDPHRVIAYQFVPLLAEGGAESVHEAIALLHASGAWSVTELVGYHPPRGEGLYDCGPVDEYLLDVTAMNRITPPPPGFELTLHTLHRILQSPVYPPEGGKPPHACCASCGEPFAEKSPIRGISAYRCIAYERRRYRVIASRYPETSDWICYACQGRSDEEGRSLPFEPWSTCIREDGSPSGHLPWFMGMQLNSIRFGHGRAWLQKLGYTPVKTEKGYDWRRPQVTLASAE